MGKIGYTKTNKEKKVEVKHMNKIQTVMEKLGAPSLKAIAMVFSLAPVRIYTVAKQPQEGKIYDAKEYNWDAIERFIEKRLDAARNMGTLEDVIARALEIDIELAQNDGRRGSNRGITPINTIIVDGKEIPARRYPNFEMAAGKPLVFRNDAKVYQIVMQTESCTVVRAIDKDGAFVGNDIKLFSNGTLNSKATSEVTLEKDIAERFSGEYVKRLAATLQANADRLASEVS